MVLIDCESQNVPSSYVQWYSQRDGEPLKRVAIIATKDLRTPEMQKKNTNWYTEPGFDQVSVEKTGNNYPLKIVNLEITDSATYYCAYSDYHSADHIAHPVTITLFTGTLLMLPTVLEMQ